VYEVTSASGLLDQPPYDEGYDQIGDDLLRFHCSLPRSAECSICQFLNLSPKRPGWGLVIQAGAALAMPVRHQVCPLPAEATPAPARECTDPRGSMPPRCAREKQPRRPARRLYLRTVAMPE